MPGHYGHSKPKGKKKKGTKKKWKKVLALAGSTRASAPLALSPASRVKAPTASRAQRAAPWRAVVQRVIQWLPSNQKAPATRFWRSVRSSAPLLKGSDYQAWGTYVQRLWQADPDAWPFQWQVPCGCYQAGWEAQTDQVWSARCKHKTASQGWKRGWQEKARCIQSKACQEHCQGQNLCSLVGK